MNQDRCANPARRSGNQPAGLNREVDKLETKWDTIQTQLGCTGCKYLDTEMLGKGPACTYGSQLEIDSNGKCLIRKEWRTEFKITKDAKQEMEKVMASNCRSAQASDSTKNNTNAKNEIMDCLEAEMKNADMALKNVQMIAAQLSKEYENKNTKFSNPEDTILNRQQALWFKNIVGRLDCQYDFFMETIRTLYKYVLEKEIPKK